jgi:4,5-dihydroxyphthalate decarboxylase
VSVRHYFQDTGSFPITHTLVTHKRVISQHPWLCQELVTAFNEADRRCRLEYEYPKRFSFPTAVLFLEEEEQQFGKNPWTHGLEPNRSVLKKFVQYAHEQGYIPSEPALDDLFAAME